MNDKQIAIVLYQLHAEKNFNFDEILDSKLDNFDLNAIEKSNHFDLIKLKYENGIKHLNDNQLKNIITKINSDGYSDELIKERLKFYEVKDDNFEYILNFFNWYTISNKPIDVSKIDENFKGVQVASRDDFNMIINQGYTGDWVLTPSSVKNRYVQVASMNETGTFPRGNYLNAEIEKFEPIKYGDQTRFRIFIKNPVVIDSGNRNVKFNLNPVKYIN